MITYILMGLLLLSFAFISIWNCKYVDNANNCFDLKHTAALKGIFCILVILVHVPEANQNKIQDMLGSFAYIGVTFYFMASAYGLKYGVKHKKNYLKHFWRNRFTAILIPAIVINILSFLIKLSFRDNCSALSIIDINDWVKLLILYYIAFYIIYGLIPEKLLSEKYKDILLCLFVILTSLIDKFTSLKITFIWPTESIGFVYGIIFANLIQQFKAKTEVNYKMNSILLIILSLILGIAYLKFKPIYFLGDYCLKILLGFALLLTLLYITSHIRIENRFNQFLAGISYEVYLLHGIIFWALERTNFHLSSGVFIWISIIITIVLSVICSNFSKVILKKIRI